jgi:hypothetical protein
MLRASLNIRQSPTHSSVTGLRLIGAAMLLILYWLQIAFPAQTILRDQITPSASPQMNDFSFLFKTKRLPNAFGLVNKTTVNI